jgi:hypothetical protein
MGFNPSIIGAKLFSMIREGNLEARFNPSL